MTFEEYVVAALIIFIVVGIALSVSDSKKIVSIGIFPSFIISFFIVFVFSIIGIMVGILSAPSTPSKIVEKNFEISSLNMKNNISGDFVLGSGQINNTYHYMAFKEINSNTYKKVQFPANHCTVHEDENENPYVHIKYETITFGHPLAKEELFNKLKVCEIHVPKGTIIKSYSLNK